VIQLELPLFGSRAWSNPVMLPNEMQRLGWPAWLVAELCEGFQDDCDAGYY
jgi:hypothetical protein